MTPLFLDKPVLARLCQCHHILRLFLFSATLGGKRRSLTKTCLRIIIVVFSIAPRALYAMEFKSVTYHDGTIGIMGSGPVIHGDEKRFGDLLKGYTPDQLRKIRGMSLNSDGGSALDGEDLAVRIHHSNIKVAVLNGDRCASACFMLFASAIYKFASPGARIGVHSPRLQGLDDTNPKAAKLRVELGAATLKDLRGYGVPDTILTKLLLTTPDHITWLTADDLSRMGVQFLKY